MLIKDVALMDLLFSQPPKAGSEKIVQMILDAGANVYQRGGKFGSALGAACNPYIGVEDNQKVMQMLLDAEADFIGEVLVGQFWRLVEGIREKGTDSSSDDVTQAQVQVCRRCSIYVLA